jgi:hypothetical protein
MSDRVRVWEFQGAELDLLVAQAAGMQAARIVDGVCMIARSQTAESSAGASLVHFRPSASWTDAGPIVEQHKISVWRYPNLDSWHAGTEFDFVRSEGLQVRNYCQGPTPLVAAMRCFVASKLWTDAQEGMPPPARD